MCTEKLKVSFLTRKCSCILGIDTFCRCSTSTKYTLFQAYCAPMYTSNLWCEFINLSLKSITVAYNNSLRILLNLPSRCSVCFMFATNYINYLNHPMNAFAHPYSIAFYVVFISLKPSFCQILPHRYTFYKFYGHILEITIVHMIFVLYFLSYF